MRKREREIGRSPSSFSRIDYGEPPVKRRRGIATTLVDGVVSGEFHLLRRWNSRVRTARSARAHPLSTSLSSFSFSCSPGNSCRPVSQLSLLRNSINSSDHASYTELPIECGETEEGNSLPMTSLNPLRRPTVNSSLNLSNPTSTLPTTTVESTTPSRERRGSVVTSRRSEVLRRPTGKKTS